MRMGLTGTPTTLSNMHGMHAAQKRSKVTSAMASGCRLQMRVCWVPPGSSRTASQRQRAACTQRHVINRSISCRESHLAQPCIRADGVNTMANHSMRCSSRLLGLIINALHGLIMPDGNVAREHTCSSIWGALLYPNTLMGRLRAQMAGMDQLQLQAGSCRHKSAHPPAAHMHATSQEACRRL